MVERAGAAYMVDAMSSFGAIPLDLAAARIDFLISSANKCIEGVPGFGFVLARRLIVLSFQRVYQRCAGLRTQRESLPAAGSRCSGA